MPRKIKRGCSEFSKSYPNFEEIDPKSSKFMFYNRQWIKKEKIIDEKTKNNVNREINENSLNGITLKDVLVFQNWLYYAKSMNDVTYKLINNEIHFSNFMNEKIINKRYNEELI